MDTNDVFVLNLRLIASRQDFPAVVRMTAMNLMSGNGYFSWGRWLQELSDTDLQLLAVISELDPADPSNDSSVGGLVALTNMLAQAEGIPLDHDIQAAAERLNWFGHVITVESLKRKGLIEVFYENISADASMSHLQIAKLIDQPQGI